MANRLEIAFIASRALLLVTANEVRQTFTQRFTPVPAEQPRGVRCPGRGDPPHSPAVTKPGQVPGGCPAASPGSIPAGRLGPRVNESAQRPSNLSQLTSQ